MNEIEAREELIAAVLSLLSNRQYVDMRPEDPHGFDSIDYSLDRLDEAAANLIKAKAQSKP